jgi:hypothetical protein
LEPILALPPDLPPHDAAARRPVPHRIVAEWPKGTFLENLAVLDDGEIAVSVMSEARLDRVRISGERRVLRQFDRPVTGLATMGRNLFVAIGEPGAETPVIWRLDPDTGAGEPWVELRGALFANGVTPFDAGRLLVAESWAGRLLIVDLVAKTVGVWLEDERLTRAPGIPFLPGANGVKRFGDCVLVSSNGRALMLRADIRPDGSAGPLILAAERLRADDFAFDAEGSVYLCTHIGHSLDRLDSAGERVSLGGAPEGLAGSTSCAFGRHGDEREALYVATTGGIVLPPDGILQPARLVRLAVGVAGHPLGL